MQWETIDILIQRHLNAGTFLLGLLILGLTFFIAAWYRDLRPSIFVLLLAIVFTGLRNPVLHMAFYILRWLILALIAIRLLFRRVKFSLSATQIIFLLWAFAAMLSAFQAPSFFRGVVFGTVYFLCFFVFFILQLAEIETEEQVRGWFRMFGFLGWTFLLISLAVFILDPSMDARIRQGRFAGLFANPMTLSRNLVFAGTIFVWNGLRQKSRLFLQLLYTGAVLVCGFLMLLTGSRGALAGFAVTLVVLALHYRKKMVILIIPLVVAVSFYAVPKVMRASGTQFVTHMSSLEAPARPMLRQRGMELFKEKPILGWGLGSLSDLNARVLPHFVSLHNSYLNFLVEFGLPGFLIVMSLLSYTYLRICKLALFEAQNNYIRDVSWFIIANLTMLFAWNYFDGALSSLSSIHFYWLMILIVLTECLVRINRRLMMYDFAPESSSEFYQEYGRQVLYG